MSFDVQHIYYPIDSTEGLSHGQPESWEACGSKAEIVNAWQGGNTTVLKAKLPK